MFTSRTAYPRRLPYGIIAVTLVALAVTIVLTTGEILSRPALQPIGAASSDLEAESIQISVQSSTAPFVRGWLARGKPGNGAVLLLHGVRSNRTQMIDRARFLKRAGYSVLLIDLPAHGESPGERITFGARESAGVEAAIAFLRTTLPNDRIGVIGVSLGAASLVLARPNPSPDAVILESMYPTITEAVADRLAIKLGAIGRTLAPLLLWQLPLRTGITTEELRPIDAIATLDAPVLIAAGTEDRHTLWDETVRIHSAASEPKALWAVHGAAHVDLHRFSGREYESRVLDFLAQWLRR